jgi:DNA repair exonuclease SbcCD ATPase subunit
MRATPTKETVMGEIKLRISRKSCPSEIRKKLQELKRLIRVRQYKQAAMVLAELHDVDNELLSEAVHNFLARYKRVMDKSATCEEPVYNDNCRRPPCADTEPEVCPTCGQKMPTEEEDLEPLYECFACGQPVCEGCSSIRKYLHYGLQRLHFSCQITNIDNGDSSKVENLILRKQ